MVACSAAQPRVNRAPGCVPPGQPPPRPGRPARTTPPSRRAETSHPRDGRAGLARLAPGARPRTRAARRAGPGGARPRAAHPLPGDAGRAGGRAQPDRARPGAGARRHPRSRRSPGALSRRRGRDRLPSLRHHPSPPGARPVRDQRGRHPQRPRRRHGGGRAARGRRLVEQPGGGEPACRPPIRRSEPVPSLPALRGVQAAHGGAGRGGGGDGEGRDRGAPAVLVLRPGAAGAADALLQHDPRRQGAAGRGRHGAALDVVHRQHLPGAPPGRAQRGGARAPLLGRRPALLHDERDRRHGGAPARGGVRHGGRAPAAPPPGAGEPGGGCRRRAPPGDGALPAGDPRPLGDDPDHRLLDRARRARAGLRSADRAGGGHAALDPLVPGHGQTI